MAAVTIDSTWLTNNGPAPYVLNAAGTVYTLGVDVNVTDAGFSGEPFKLVGDVQLVLNGHTVRVNGAYVPQVLDGRVYRKLPGYNTVRAVPANPVKTFGGVYQTGTGTKPVIDPTSPEYPPLVPFADTK